MKKKIQYLFVIILIIICFFYNKLESNDNNDSYLINNRKLLKDYYFTKCMIYSLDTCFVNKDCSTGIIFDLLHYDSEAIKIVDNIAHSFVQNIPTTIYENELKKKSIIFNCLEMYNSNVLDSIINSMDKYLH